jgi:trk system potassium uptake protein TrkA
MKTYAVIGLGNFGSFVAKKLVDEGINVIAIDNTDSKVEYMGEFTDNAIILDSTNIRALKEAGIINLDVVIVSIGENIEASILTVMALKDLGNKTIIAKAINQIHGEILSKIGAFKVIFPEKLAGSKLVQDIIGDLTFDKIDFSNSVKILKLLITKSLIGKSIQEIEEKYLNIKFIGYKINGNWLLSLNKNITFEVDTMVAFIGKNQDIDNFSNLI